MFITRTVTKKVLETIVHETFSTFGNLSSSSLLDSLKFLGFYYATTAGISINIEDLKTPNVKKEFLANANKEMEDISIQWQRGFVSDTERFQTIIDSWNSATESLKNRIIDYYQHFDPANNLYIMAFSGARGNMSQVRQLVGMRGLMSDQEGRIIDLPIQANFREGLSSLDYIISSYGARKGIVDTALKTADSGYLTRRLIYIAQDLVIREIDCRTTRGVLIFLTKKSNFKSIIGRTLLSVNPANGASKAYGGREGASKERYFFPRNTILTEPILQEITKFGTITVHLRSALTCNSSGSICQQCYGWDLAQEKLISLGEAIGIIAAQSIGEPGTQLTMRTFHTGGIFTSELSHQIVAPFSGKFILPSLLKTIPYRTSHGKMVLKLKQETLVTLVDWKGKKETIFLAMGSYLYVTTSTFLKKGDLISQYSGKSFGAGTRKLKPIYSAISGEIRYESLFLRYIARKDQPSVKVNEDDGILWLASGKIFPIPQETKYTFPREITKKKAFGLLHIVAPFSGIVKVGPKEISVENTKKKIVLEFSTFLQTLQNCITKFSIFVKNFQYIDPYTLLGTIEIFPKTEAGKIYSIKKKDSLSIQTLFAITESDIWKINSDQRNNYAFFPQNHGMMKGRRIIRAGTMLNTTSIVTKSGFFLKRDGFKMLFQNAIPVFLTRGTILNYQNGNFVFEKQMLAALVNYTQQTADIVQGLPKIEDLIEARIPKNAAILSLKPGVSLQEDQPKIFMPLGSDTLQKVTREGDVFRFTYIRKRFEEQIDKNEKKQTKQFFSIIHSLPSKEKMVFYENKIWKVTPIPVGFEPEEKESKSDNLAYLMRTHQKFFFTRKEEREIPVEEKNSQMLVVEGKIISTSWILLKDKIKRTTALSKKEQDSILSQIENSYLYKYHENKMKVWKKAPDLAFFYVNKKGDYMMKLNSNQFFLLECIPPITQYKASLSMKFLFSGGSFIDIGEPITEGNINPHQLLRILYQYHLDLDGTMEGTIRSLNKFQLILINSIQAIYQSQGVNISTKHIEVIVRQMTSKVKIRESGDTPFLVGEIIRLSLMNEVFHAFKDQKKAYKSPKYEPVFLSTTKSSLNKDGFLSAAGFQETKRVLTKAALEGASDWLRGLKECVITGRLIPAGSAFLNYKNYLDNIYLYKKKENNSPKEI